MSFSREIEHGLTAFCHLTAERVGATESNARNVRVCGGSSMSVALSRSYNVQQKKKNYIKKIVAKGLLDQEIDIDVQSVISLQHYRQCTGP